MRVIMSMIVLMPSWSYSLLMSNVLFKHSLADHRTCIYRARCIYVPRPKDPPATCTSRDGDLGACNLNPPRPCAPPRLVHGYRYSRGYESATRNRPPRAAAATRSGPIDRYADTRPAAGTTFTGKVFKFRHATARGAERRHGTFTAPTGTAHPRRPQRVARSFRRRVGASRDGGYFWTALEHA